MSTPNLTPAQLVASATSIVGLFVTQGAVTNETGKIIGGLASILIPLAWLIADAIIRHGRSKIVAAQVQMGPLVMETPSDAILAEQVRDATAKPTQPNGERRHDE